MEQRLRRAKAQIMAEWVKRMMAEQQCLLPVLPVILDQLDAELQGHPDQPIRLNFIGHALLSQVVDEICLLREVLTDALGELTRAEQKILHRFMDRCLQAAAAQLCGLGDGARFVPTPMCVLTGPEFIFTLTNEAYEKLVGRPVLGQKMLEAFRPEEIDYFAPLVEQVYQSGISCVAGEVQLRVPMDTGMIEDHWIDFGCYPVGDAQSEMRGVLVLCYDVTDRVRIRQRVESSEYRLKQTEEQLARAMTVSKVGFYDWDMRKNTIEMNEQMRLDWGSDKAILRPEELGRFLHPDDLEHARARGHEAMDEKKAFSDQYRIIRADNGKVVWIEAQGEVTFDVDGTPLRFFGTTRNITQAKEIELAMAAEKHKFEAIFLDSPAPMALWRGPEFIFEQVNPQFARFFAGRSFVGKRLLEALPELESQGFLPIMQRVYETGESFHSQEIKLNFAAVDGGDLQENYLNLSLTRILDGTGKPYGIFSHALVVTDMVRVRKEAQAASLAKSNFLANMSHEIRTPLGAILGFSALLKDPEMKDKERDQYVDTIVRNGEALMRIIDDILDLAKVEAGRLEIEYIDFSLKNLVFDVLRLFQEQARQKGIYLILDDNPWHLDRICSDPIRLRQILVNLVGNAVKFTQIGGIRIRISLQPTDDGIAAITIDVSDTGIGLTEEQKGRLFQPFVQADTSMTRKFGGTGLGLALSRRLAQALGGDIEIRHSEPGQGSIFSLHFIATPAQSEDEVEGQSSSKPLELRDVSVLAVDDSPDNLFLVKRFLTRSGARVDTAPDGMHAIEMAAQKKHDIILMDIQMPEMDGYQTIKALRARGYTKPIVALTAHAMVDERTQTRNAGFAAHLTKPLDVRELLSTVVRLTHLDH